MGQARPRPRLISMEGRRRQNFDLEFPEYKTVIDASKQPDWKTQVGYFKTRLEADRVLTIISEKFVGAIVLKDKI